MIESWYKEWLNETEDRIDPCIGGRYLIDRAKSELGVARTEHWSLGNSVLACFFDPVGCIVNQSA